MTQLIQKLPRSSWHIEHHGKSYHYSYSNPYQKPRISTIIFIICMYTVWEAEKILDVIWMLKNIMAHFSLKTIWNKNVFKAFVIKDLLWMPLDFFMYLMELIGKATIIPVSRIKKWLLSINNIIQLNTTLYNYQFTRT